MRIRIIDSHIHFQSASLYDLELMSLAGVDVIVGFSQPTYRFSYPETYFDHYERLLRFEKARAESVGIKVYLALGISPKAMIKDPFVVVEKLERYLQLDFVVAIGESGLTNYNDVVELETLKIMFELGRKFKKPVFVDLPDDYRKQAIKKIEKLASDADIPPELVVLNEIDFLTALDVEDLPFWFGFTLWPESTKNMVENIFKGDLPLDRVILSSNFDSLARDPLAFPKTALELKLKGYDEFILDKVLYENPKRLFKLE